MTRLDHGILNLPLSKRGGGSLDAQIDRWKADQARAAKVEAKAQAARNRERRAVEGSAKDQRERAIAAAVFAVGQVVDTAYGHQVVTKVNAKSIVFQGGSGPINVPKHLARPVRSRPTAPTCPPEGKP